MTRAVSAPSSLVWPTLRQLLLRYVRLQLSHRTFRKHPWRHFVLDPAYVSLVHRHVDRIGAALIHPNVVEEDRDAVRSGRQLKIMNAPGSLARDAVDDDGRRAEIEKK